MQQQLAAACIVETGARCQLLSPPPLSVRTQHRHLPSLPSQYIALSSFHVRSNPCACVDDRVGNLSAGAGFAVELVLDVAALPKKPLRDLALFDCRAPAKSTPRGMKRPGIVLSFSNIATMTDEWTGAAYTIKLEMTDGDGRNQSYHTDSEARLWLQQEHHVTTVVDGFSRTITSVTNGVFADGGSERGQGWAHLGSIPNIAGEGDIEVVDGANSCVVHPTLRALRVYDRYLMTTEAVGSWRAWKR
jgi:hypothetical protein